MDKTRHITVFLPDLSDGGAERVSVNLANHLVQRGYAVDMLLASASGPFINHLRKEIHLVDLQASRMRHAMFPLIRYLKSAKPDAMLVCMWPLTVLSVIARQIARVSTRLVLAEHSTWSYAQADYSHAQRFLIRKTMQVFFPGADAVVTVSKGAADDLAHFAGVARNKILTIYNPVIDASSAPSPRQPLEFTGWGSMKFKVLSVGNLKREKNQELLLRAFALLVKRVDAHLLILGEGYLRAKLEALIDELGLTGRVSMPGFMHDPAPFYQQADLFALSSDWEGLPTVLIEALAAGTPVVSTDCPSGPREILCNGKYGRLVPVGDIAALGAAMEAALFSFNDARALKARANDFSIDRAADRYLELLYPQAAKG